jgi:selenide,water dikinase
MSNSINIKEGEACSIGKKNIRLTELSRTSG